MERSSTLCEEAWAKPLLRHTDTTLLFKACKDVPGNKETHVSFAPTRCSVSATLTERTKMQRVLQSSSIPTRGQFDFGCAELPTYFKWNRSQDLWQKTVPLDSATWMYARTPVLQLHLKHSRCYRLNWADGSEENM